MDYASLAPLEPISIFSYFFSHHGTVLKELKDEIIGLEMRSTWIALFFP